MNELLWIGTLLLCFTTIIVSYKFLGKTGLFIWIVVATMIANIQTVKLIELFGLETSLGNILYGSTFLATDILNYKYGVKESRKSIIYGFFATIAMAIFMSICLLYKPSANDFTQDSLNLIFSFNIRVTIASLTGFGISQFIDTYLFNHLQKKYNKLWLSNNVSTMVCQIIDTVIFTLIAYFGKIPLTVVFEVMFSMYIFKFIVAFLDTPFMYMAAKMKKVHNE